jgi:predicted lipid-binding transport protein (Tim44 family)
MMGKKSRYTGIFAICLAVFTMVAEPADARRSFGSRGSRTAAPPPATAVAPKQVAPVQRSTTQKPASAQAAGAPRAAAGQPSRFGGLAKGLLGGIIAGGLLGMLMGNGFGALAGSGMLMALLQIALIGGLVWFGFRMFRRRSMAAPAGAGMASYAGSPVFGGNQGGFTAAPRPMPVVEVPSHEIAITRDDQQSFERLLTEVQEAFAAEDYARLRACTTPEVMSYLAEELSENATSGLRNEVFGTKLLEAEIAEAWNEGAEDFATVAMKYECIDVMRDRQAGTVVEGDPDRPSSSTELWTFVRRAPDSWRVSAIQQD